MRRLALLALVAAACNGISQSPECRRYLGCVDALNPGGSASYSSSYGEHGTCWSTDQASADLCSKACADGSGYLADAGRNLDACR